MRKNKLFSGFLATALALTTMSTSAFAVEVDTHGSSTDVSGSGTVIAAEEIYDVLLPSNLSYAVDVEGHLKDSTGVINVENSAIYSASFGVINHSSTPLQIDVSLKAESTTQVAVVSEDAIIANNALTSSSLADISKDASVSLKIAPVNSSASITATSASSLADSSATAAAVTFGNSDVATSKAVEITSGGASITFALTNAAYEISKDGISLETTNGGFNVSGNATDIEKVYKAGQTAYDDDPVVGFTIIGAANKYADWAALVDEADALPTITATFTLTPLSNLEYDAIVFDDEAGDADADGGLVVSSPVSGVQTAYALDDLGEIWFALAPFDADGVSSNPGFENVTYDSLNVKVDGNAVDGRVQDGYMILGYDAYDGAVWNVTFTVDGINYAVVVQ